MGRIERTFEELRKRRETALVGFVTAGDPTIPVSLDIIKSMCEAGLDILEMGVPFSDPTADGPVIQRSSGRAIRAGMNLDRVLKMAREIRKFTETPIVIFSYYNPILAYGRSRFYSDAAAAGADGLLVVDLPPEESDELTREWPGRDLALIRLVAPTTPLDRMTAIADGASGFLYLVSMTGVTGSGAPDIRELDSLTANLRSRCNGIPVCIGFGISEPAQAKAMGSLADGIVVGSAFERIIETNLDSPALPSQIGAAVKGLKDAVRSA